MNRILVFHYWAVFASKDAGAEYDTASATGSDYDWVYSIMYEYFMEDPKETSKSTEFYVTIPSFIGTSWYEVKSHMMQLLANHIGAAGTSFSYMIRDTPQDWENTNRIISLQDSRTATKMHFGK